MTCFPCRLHLKYNLKMKPEINYAKQIKQTYDFTVFWQSINNMFIPLPLMFMYPSL